jgi:capsular exopolysaccharide synthesis family protein
MSRAVHYLKPVSVNNEMPFTRLNDSYALTFDFHHLFHLLLRKWWVIALLTILSVGAAVLYLMKAPKIYQSTAVVEVESKSGHQAELTHLQSALQGELLERQANLTKAQADRDKALADLAADERLVQRGLIAALDFKKAQIAASELSTNYEVEKQRYETARINNVQDFYTGDNGGDQEINLEENVKTVEQAILSDTLLLDVLKSNGLEKDPSFAPPKKDGSVYLDSELVAGFRSRVKATVRPRTRLIDVSVKDTDPKRAAQLAAAIVKDFVDQNSEEPYANNRLQQEADRLKANLQDAEQAVQKYRESHGSVSPDNPLVREVENDRALYQSVVTRMKVADIANGNSGKNIRVVSTPLVPANAAEPEKSKILLVALLVGITSGCGLVLGLDKADNSIRSIHQVERISGLPVLASLPESKRKDVHNESALTAEPASYEAETFRSLRTALSLLGQDQERKTILFTSANPGEGKSYCALNYAVALAQLGLRTLLIDADLRRQNLSKMVLLNTWGPALSSCLSQAATITDCCRPTGIKNLFMLGAGGRVAKPAELFASNGFANLLKEALLHFDRVVVDSAPINPVSDTQLIAKEVESVCLVVRAGKTPQRAIVRACSLLAKVVPNPEGIILNRMAQAARDNYYFSAYGQAYGHLSTNGSNDSIVRKLIADSEETGVSRGGRKS